MTNETIDSKQDQADWKSPETLENEVRERKERWESIRTEVEGITDGLGKGIDQGIKESVIAFIAFNIPTIQSCEGHLEENEGLPYPWLDVEIESQSSETPKPQKLHKMSKVEHHKIMSLLSEFYTNRTSPSDARLIIDFDENRIKSLGGEELKLIDRAQDIFRQRFELYQTEMKDFTKFLKQKYFQEGSEKIQTQAENYEDNTETDYEMTLEDKAALASKLKNIIKDIPNEPSLEHLAGAYTEALAGDDPKTLKIRRSILRNFQGLISRTIKNYLPISAQRELSPLLIELANYDNTVNSKIDSFKALVSILLKHKHIFERYGITEQQIAKLSIEQIQNSK